MPYYANGLWYNWTSYLTNHTVNATDPPIQAMYNAVGNALPWFWPAFPLILYVYLWVIYNDAPANGKLMGIAALALVISIIMAAFGMIPDAIINVVIFGVAFFVSPLFKL